jgi:hypothetical protein
MNPSLFTLNMSSSSCITKDEDAPANAEAQDTAQVMRFGPIIESLEKYGPVFRRERFEAAYAAYRAIDDDEPEPKVYQNHFGRESMRLRTRATLPDMYDIGQELQLDKAGIMNTIDGKTHIGKRLWHYCDLQDLAWRLSFGYTPLLPFQFCFRDMPVDETCGPIEPEYHRKAAGWRAEWEATRRVDHIVCFGLGCPVSAARVQWQRRSYVQHRAACTIRDLLVQHQGGMAPKVSAQEPEYTSVDITYLEEHFGMAVLDDPEAFRVLDGNTFIITVAPNVPVRQVAFDMTYEQNGPAGFLCDIIYSDGLESEGKKEDDVGRFTCNPSPALWKYKQESVLMEFDDAEEMDCFGNMGVYLKRSGRQDINE